MEGGPIEESQRLTGNHMLYLSRALFLVSGKLSLTPMDLEQTSRAAELAALDYFLCHRPLSGATRCTQGGLRKVSLSTPYQTAHQPRHWVLVIRRSHANSSGPGCYEP